MCAARPRWEMLSMSRIPPLSGAEIETPTNPGARRESPPASNTPPEKIPDVPDPLRHFRWRWQWWLTFAVTLAANFVFVTFLFPGQPQRVEVSYTLFKQQVLLDNVTEIRSRADTIQGSFRSPVAYPPDAEKTIQVSDFSTVQPAFADPGIGVAA